MVGEIIPESRATSPGIRSQWRLLPKEFPPFSTVQRFFLSLAGRRALADNQIILW